MSEAESVLRLERRSEGVGLLVFDAPGESVNTLRESFAQEFHRAIDEIEADVSIRAVVLLSAKADNFIAGADIHMLSRAADSQQAESLARTGQDAVARIANCSVPVVAAMHGACLGGGLEIALACQGRVASSSDKTKLGLPEVQLGILPGMGGTQRLPQLVGLQVALDLLLTGKQLNSKRAKKVGLVDEVVPPGILAEVAVKRALQLSAQVKKQGSWSALGQLLRSEELRELALADNPLGRKVVFDQARKQLRSKTQGNYPAPEKILEVVRQGLERGFKEGLVSEARVFGELVVSKEASALRHIYFSQQSLKKDDGPISEAPPVKCERVAVLGAGLMGAGVAYVSTVSAGASVRLKDVSSSNLSKGLKVVGDLLDEGVKRRKLSPWQRTRLLSRLTRTTDMSGMGSQDLVIEAVFEDLELKRKILAEVEEAGGERTIFASNSSSLPIAEIAKNAHHKDRVIGMHYFSPVNKMPLLEVIVTEDTADWVTKSCVDFGKRQKKTVIVVGDGPGFYTSRILAPYLNEAAHGLLEGRSIEAIDKELVSAGFPVGPLNLLDEVGIDVGTKVAKTLTAALGNRLAPPAALRSLIDDGRLGKKAQRGFYDYSQSSKAKGSHRTVDESVYGVLGLALPKSGSPVAGGLSEPGSMAERCLLQMVNEAVLCLEEGVLRCPRDGDIGAIFGLGFPPYLGGPFHLIDAWGAEEVLGRLQRLEREFGSRFRPAPLLVEVAGSGGTFVSRN